MFLWILLLDLFGSCFSYKTLLLSFESFYSNWWFSLCLHNSCSILLRSRKRQTAKKPKATRATKATKATKATRAKKPDWKKKTSYNLRYNQGWPQPFGAGRPSSAATRLWRRETSACRAISLFSRRMVTSKYAEMEINGEYYNGILWDNHWKYVYNGFSLKFLLPLPILELLRSPESFSQPQVPELGLRQLGALPPGTRMLKQIFCDCLTWFVDI